MFSCFCVVPHPYGLSTTITHWNVILVRCHIHMVWAPLMCSIHMVGTPHVVPNPYGCCTCEWTYIHKIHKLHKIHTYIVVASNVLMPLHRTDFMINELLWRCSCWSHAIANLMYDQWASVVPKVLILYQRKHLVCWMRAVAHKGTHRHQDWALATTILNLKHSSLTSIGCTHHMDWGIT